MKSASAGSARVNHILSTASSQYSSNISITHGSFSFNPAVVTPDYDGDPCSDREVSPVDGRPRLRVEQQAYLLALNFWHWKK